MNRIRELRVGRNMSQAQLGSVLGCISATVSKYELEQSQLDPPTIKTLCAFFGVTADYLLCLSDSPFPAVTEEEAQLLTAYRAASEDARVMVKLALKPWAEPQYQGGHPL